MESEIRIHFCPSGDLQVMECCGFFPFEVPVTDQTTAISEDVTCNVTSEEALKRSLRVLRAEIRAIFPPSALIRLLIILVSMLVGYAAGAVWGF